MCIRAHICLLYVGTQYFLYDSERGGQWEQVYNNYIIMMYVPILRTTQGERTVSTF